MPAFIGGTGVAYPVSGTELGLALETTKGTLQTQPTYQFPIKSPNYEPDQTYIPDETLQGSAVQVYDEVLGMRYDKHGWSGPPYLDSFPLLLCAELGSNDNKTTAPTGTTLSSTASPGSSTISVAATIASGSYITIGTYPTLETHYTTAVSGSGPFTVTLNTPVIFTQNSGNTVTGLTKHQFSLYNRAQFQPPSLSLWDNDNEEWRTISAFQLDQLTIKGNGTGLIDYTLTGIGNAATNNASAPTISLTGTQTPAPWTVQFVLGGSQLTSLLTWEIEMKRDTKPIPALTGTQAYFEYFANTLQLTSKVTFVEASGSPFLGAYERGTKQAFDLTFFDMVAGAACNFHSSSVSFTTGKLNRPSEYAEVEVTVQHLPTSADALANGVSPILATVANSVTTAYYSAQT